MTPITLVNLATKCRLIIELAQADGLTIDDGNVVDLLADNIPQVPLETFRDALVVAGYSAQFPVASTFAARNGIAKARQAQAERFNR